MIEDDTKKLSQDLLNAWQGLYSSFAANPDTFKSMVAFARNFNENMFHNGNGKENNAASAASPQQSGNAGEHGMDELIRRFAAIESRLGAIEDALRIPAQRTTGKGGSSPVAAEPQKRSGREAKKAGKGDKPLS